MSKVVQLDSRRSDPHLSGPARCLTCEHEWVAVSPVGTNWMECPSCHLLRGHYVFPASKGDSAWRCNCGNGLFEISPDGAYCPNCGLDQEF